jgi:hypothetical protein
LLCLKHQRGLTALNSAAPLALIAVSGTWTFLSRADAKAARWQRYLSDMHAAVSAWDEGDTRRVVSLLERHVPDDRESDPRGFEWYYLYNETHPRDDRIVIESSTLRQNLAYSPNGT